MKPNKLLIAAIVAALAGSAHAGTIAGTGGSTEVTQMMNLTELLSQTASQMQMVQQGIQQVNQMTRDAQRFSSDPLGLSEITGVYNRVVSEVQSARALTYGVQNAAANFQQIHPSFNPLGQYDPMAYANRSKITMQSIQSAIQAGSSLWGRAQTDQQRIEALGQKVNTSDGTTQTLQTANAVQYEVLHQLQDTKMYTQQVNDAQMSFMAMQLSNQNKNEEGVRKVFSSIKSNSLVP